MNRKIYHWKLRSVELQLGGKTLIMGILNVTPDSFSDGGQFSDPDRAYARALELEEQGADIIDLGAESTSPGSQRVSAEEEWRRLVPVLKRLRDKLSIPLSLDTYKAEVAERAFEYGVEIVNDPSGLTFDADLAKTAANANAGLILNHMRGTPETWARLPPLPDMIGSVARDLEATVNRARRAGVDRTRIVVDPGLGFGKRREQNIEIVAYLRQLAALDHPILVGPSRKSFLALGTEPETLFATASAVAVSVMNGAHMVRVHDVKEMRAVVQIADEFVRAGDVRQAAEAAVVAAERPVPRRIARDSDDRPRSVTPPVSRPEPRPEPLPERQEKRADPVEATATPVVVSPVVPVVVAPVAAPPVVAPVAVPPVREVRVERKVVRRETGREGSDARREVRPAAGGKPRPAGKPYGDRPPRREFPPRSAGKGAPSGDRRPPARRDSGDRPPRREFSDRPPRRDFGAKPPAGAGTGGDRPPRRDFGDRPPRRDSGPPRRDSGSRPPTGGRPAGGDPRDKGRGEGGSKRPPSRPFRKRP